MAGVVGWKENKRNHKNFAGHKTENRDQKGAGPYKLDIVRIRRTMYILRLYILFDRLIGNTPTNRGVLAANAFRSHM